MRLFKRIPLKSSEISLGPAVVDGDTGRLRHSSGAEIALRHRSREVLRVLVSRRNEVVTRAALVTSVWGVETVSDDNISQCIPDIRRAIPDPDKRIIETVPRQGYRLVVPDPSFARTGVSRFAPSSGPTDNPAEADQTVVVVDLFDMHGEARGLPSGFRNILAEAILTELARYPELTVRMKQPLRPFHRQGLAAVFARSRADFTVAGSVAGDGPSVRIAVRLVSDADHSWQWAEAFDVDLAETLPLTRTIARGVAGAVGVRMIEVAERRVNQGELSAMLIENAARARMLRLRSPVALRQNLEDQEIALDRYPDACWGYIGQALAIRTGIGNGWLHEQVDAMQERAEMLATTGLRVGADNYLAHYALGKTLQGTGERQRAVRAFETAIRLNPSSAMVLRGAVVPTLNIGQVEQALKLITQCRAIERTDDRALSYLEARTYWQMGAPDRALESLLSDAEWTSDKAKLLAVLHNELGHRQTARVALERFVTRNREWSIRQEADLLERNGTPADVADRWLSQLAAVGLAS
ncbi:MAG: winged helix-turn-helix domain-containing protein [Pseudomonadota bacterium]|nr:winged helix-turn-helix domain-containing protein [Pseudomonadota bacterium]